MFIKAIPKFEKADFSWKYKGEKKRKYKKRSVSRIVRSTHAVIEVDGTERDYEMAKRVMREAARNYNHLSQKEMSYEVKLLSNE